MLYLGEQLSKSIYDYPSRRHLPDVYPALSNLLA